MSYWRYWQLNSAPFSDGTGAALFRGDTVEEALARIEFLITNSRSVGSLVGPSGVGKSTILRHCGLVPPTGRDIPSLEVVRTSLLGLASGELLSDLATRLSGSRQLPSHASAWNVLCDYFRASEREEIRTVLLVDDTESGSAAAEADLNRLVSMRFPLTVVFAVESQMQSAVSRSLLERTELQIELPGWEVGQTGEFLYWSTQRLGRDSAIFTEGAVELVQQMSRGLPRRIIQLADLALVAGAVSGLDVVDVDCIEQVAWELPNSAAA